jgi:hypothetical protein
MINTSVSNKWRLGGICLAAGLAMSAAPIVHAHGGGGGHGGAGGFGHGGRGGFGPDRFGHGGRGGFGYDRFGYGRGFYGFDLLGYGLFFDALPLYYLTYGWGGIPYYYANDNFFQLNGSVGPYETVHPPQVLVSQVGTTQAIENASLFAYPKNGQTDVQQATDRIECQRWAIGQTGMDSSRARNPVQGADSPASPQDYRRAESACLEGRGYSVK